MPDGCEALGTATGGSSEAIMLGKLILVQPGLYANYEDIGGLAMKRRWQERRKAEHKDHYHPNVVFGSNAQVAIEKFARYFDVEVSHYLTFTNTITKRIELRRDWSQSPQKQVM